MIIVLIILILLYSVLFFTPPIIGDVYYFIIQIVYWGTTIFYLSKYKKKNLFCFELFFSISFFLCSFLARYLIPIMNSYESRAFIEDNTLIYKTYTLSIIGYLCYIFGLVVWKKPITVKNNTPIHFDTVSKKTNTYANLLCTLFIILMFLNGGTRMFSMYSNTDVMATDRLSGYAMYLTFAIITYIVSIVTNFSSIKRNSLSFKTPFPALFSFNSIVLIGTFLLSGYRSNAIQLIIPLVIAYQIKIKPIKPFTVILVLVSGAFLMFFIGITRTGDVFNASEYTMLTYIRDFKAANAATIFFINYVDLYGPTGGTNMLFPILSIIPGLQFFTNMFVNISDLAPVSSAFFTMAFDSTSGFGTSIIGDLYYSFGFVGVCVFMFLYGSFLCRISQSKNNYEIAMFLVFSGNAMFAPRVEYCYIIRSVSWSVIFLFLLQLYSKTQNR